MYEYVFQSTRPMRGATLSEEYVQELIDVSIHAPHAGRDDWISRAVCHIKVSIHAPHAGRDSRRYATAII